MAFLSVATVLEKNRLESDQPFLVALDIEVVDPVTGVTSEVIHLVRNSEAITFNGNPYQPAMFDITFGREASTAVNVSLTVNDYSGAIQARMEAYGGGIGFNVAMYIVNAGALTQGPEVVEHFQVIGASSKDYKCAFSLGGENEVMMTFPRRRQMKDFCPWRFKDPATCAYTGVLTTCDLSLSGANGCSVHANTLNFGAFPGLNSNGVRYA